MTASHSSPGLLTKPCVFVYCFFARKLLLFPWLALVDEQLATAPRTFQASSRRLARATGGELAPAAPPRRGGVRPPVFVVAAVLSGYGSLPPADPCGLCVSCVTMRCCLCCAMERAVCVLICLVSSQAARVVGTSFTHTCL